MLCLKIVGIYKKNIIINFSLLKAGFRTLCFAVYKMVDSEYNKDIYKSVKVSIGTVMRNLEMLKFVPDHLKSKKMCKHAFNILLRNYHLQLDMFLINIRLNKCTIKQF